VLAAAPASAGPPCPQLDGWIGPETSHLSDESAYGGVVYCSYTPSPGANLGSTTYAYVDARWVGDAEQAPAATTNYGCGRDGESLAARWVSSDGTWSYVNYGIAGAGYEGGEAILDAHQEAFLTAVAAMLPATEAFAKSCTESNDDGTDSGTTFPSSRTAGASRYETATQISQTWDSADVVYIATGANFPDALGAGPAAATESGPILLVEQNGIPSTTASELSRLGPSRIVVLGGTAAVSDAVVSALRSYAATVTRVAGANRYATAAAIASYAFPGTEPIVYVASGRSFPDPIIAGTAAALDDAPLLLVDGVISLETAVATELARLQPTQIVLVGADSEVSGALAGLAAIASVDRVNQSDIYSRSAALWDDVTAPVAEVVLATSGAFADALAGTPYAALDPPSYLMLSQSTCVPAVVLAQLQRLEPAGVKLLGGTAALSDGVASQTSC
jgi:putative cell wall-binding protein